MCPVIDHEFHHNIFELAVDPQSTFIRMKNCCLFVFNNNNLSNSRVSYSRPHWNPIKGRLMRGRNESTRAQELVKYCCCALNYKTSTQKTKDVENSRNWQMLDIFQSLRTTQIIVMLWECRSESGVCDGL